jgi:hypothetical protein
MRLDPYESHCRLRVNLLQSNKTFFFPFAYFPHNTKKKKKKMTLSASSLLPAVPSAKAARIKSEKVQPPFEVVGRNLLVLIGQDIDAHAAIGKRSIRFVIPNDMFGYPTYKVEDVARYILRYLRTLGYYAKAVAADFHLLSISW